MCMPEQVATVVVHEWSPCLDVQGSQNNTVTFAERGVPAMFAVVCSFPQQVGTCRFSCGHIFACRRVGHSKNVGCCGDNGSKIAIQKLPSRQGTRRRVLMLSAFPRFSTSVQTSSGWAWLSSESKPKITGSCRFPSFVFHLAVFLRFSHIGLSG